MQEDPGRIQIRPGSSPFKEAIQVCAPYRDQPAYCWIAVIAFRSALLPAPIDESVT